MEVQAARGFYGTVFTYEFFASAQLIFVINIAAGSDLIAFSAVLCVFTIIIILAPITGAHFNPAVSAGIFWNLPNKKANLPMYLVYNLAQFSGAFLGCFIAYFAMGLYRDTGKTVPVVALMPQGNTDAFGAFISEVILSQFYVGMILLVKSKKLAISNELVLQAIVPTLCLLTSVIATGSRSSAGINPAFGLAQTVFQNFFGTPEQQTWQYLWVYLAGPYLGGSLAAATHHAHKNTFYKLYPEKAPTWFEMANKHKIEEENRLAANKAQTLGH